MVVIPGLPRDPLPRYFAGGRWLGGRGRKSKMIGPPARMPLKRTREEVGCLTCGPSGTHGIKEDQRVVVGWPTRRPKPDTKRTRGAAVSCRCGRKSGPNLGGFVSRRTCDGQKLCFHLRLGPCFFPRGPKRTQPDEMGRPVGVSLTD